MGCRRIVTGHDSNANAIVVSDSQVPPIIVNAIPGLKNHELWNTNKERTLPYDGTLPELNNYFPEKDGTIFRKIVFPSTPIGESGIDFSPASVEEINNKLPNALSHFDPEAPGMHTTESIDYGIVLDGEIELELSKGQRTLLKAGDVVVQNGTRHAWRNHSGKPATVFFILLGARVNE